MKKILLIVLLLIPFSIVNAESGKFDLDFDEAVKAAEDFEKLLFTASPPSKKLISFFDISTKDGHLLVWVKQSMFNVKKNSRDSLYKSILNIWRDTKYVKSKNYGNWAEVKYNDHSSGKTKTIKIIK